MRVTSRVSNTPPSGASSAAHLRGLWPLPDGRLVEFKFLANVLYWIIYDNASSLNVVSTASYAAPTSGDPVTVPIWQRDGYHAIGHTTIRDTPRFHPISGLNQDKDCLYLLDFTGATATVTEQAYANGHLIRIGTGKTFDVVPVSSSLAFSMSQEYPFTAVHAGYTEIALPGLTEGTFHPGGTYTDIITDSAIPAGSVSLGGGAAMCLRIDPSTSQTTHLIVNSGGVVQEGSTDLGNSHTVFHLTQGGVGCDFGAFAHVYETTGATNSQKLRTLIFQATGIATSIDFNLDDPTDETLIDPKRQHAEYLINASSRIAATASITNMRLVSGSAAPSATVMSNLDRTTVASTETEWGPWEAVGGFPDTYTPINSTTFSVRRTNLTLDHVFIVTAPTGSVWAYPVTATPIVMPHKIGRLKIEIEKNIGFGVGTDNERKQVLYITVRCRRADPPAERIPRITETAIEFPISRYQYDGINRSDGNNNLFNGFVYNWPRGSTSFLESIIGAYANGEHTDNFYRQPLLFKNEVIDIRVVWGLVESAGNEAYSISPAIWPDNYPDNFRTTTLYQQWGSAIQPLAADADGNPVWRIRMNGWNRVLSSPFGGTPIVELGPDRLLHYEAIQFKLTALPVVHPKPQLRQHHQTDQIRQGALDSAQRTIRQGPTGVYH